MKFITLHKTGYIEDNSDKERKALNINKNEWKWYLGKGIEVMSTKKGFSIDIDRVSFREPRREL